MTNTIREAQTVARILRTLFPFKDTGNPVPNRKRRSKILEDNYDILITFFFLLQFGLYSYIIYKTLMTYIMTGYWLKEELGLYLIVIAAGLFAYGTATIINPKIMTYLLTDLYEEHVYLTSLTAGIDNKKGNKVIGLTLIGCSIVLISYLYFKT